MTEVVLSSLDVSNSGTQAGSLLGLEFDGVLQFLNLGSDFLSFGEGDGEKVHLDQYVSEKLGGLLSN